MFAHYSLSLPVKSFTWGALKQKQVEMAIYENVAVYCLRLIYNEAEGAPDEGLTWYALGRHTRGLGMPRLRRW